MKRLALLLLLATPAHSGDFYVIDGDTIVANGHHYRLVGLNTPELHARCDSEQRLAQAGKARLISLRPLAQIFPVDCECRPGTSLTPQCNYGRLCARLIIAGRDWADIAISEGLAEPYICANGHCPKRRDWCAR